MREKFPLRVDLIYNEICICLFSCREDCHFIIGSKMLQAFLEIGPGCDQEFSAAPWKCDLKVVLELTVWLLICE